MNKKGFEMSFAWLFSLIVGGVVIIIAIYAAASLVNRGEQQQSTILSAELAAFLSPLGTNLEEGTFSTITFPTETRVFSECNSEGNFGVQRIGTSEVGKRSGVNVTLINKYFFIGDEQGRQMYLFTKPFNIPYKVSDLIIGSTKEYCFVNPPNEISDDVEQLGLPFVNISSRLSGCPRNSISVCFNGGSCNVSVNTIAQSVTKKTRTVYYIGPLVYAAIVSDPEFYECQVNRLMKRTAQLGEVYAEKADFVAGQGCSTNLAADVRTFSSSVRNVERSAHLLAIEGQAEQLDRRNNNLVCPLF